MRKFLGKACFLVLLSVGVVLLTSAQSSQPNPGNSSKGASTTSPQISKAEQAAYKTFFDGRNGDPAEVIARGEAFIAKYPMSVFAEAVNATLAGAYFKTNQVAKLIDVGSKALSVNPDDVDVLPLMAMVIPRQVTAKTPDAPAQLAKAVAYARHGIELIQTMPMPLNTTPAAFAQIKNQDLALCHSGLGTVDFRTGKYDDAATELNQAVMLAATPDPVDYYLLAFADVQTSHFTEAEAAYTKCAASTSSVQGACRSGLADAKDKAKNSLQAPN